MVLRNKKWGLFGHHKKENEWMKERINEWMNEWMNEWKEQKRTKKRRCKSGWE